MKDNSKSVNLNVLNVALMFVGAIMGAGFASGREIWQFFGVFGEKGQIGVLLVGVLFIMLGTMTAYIARKLNTSDMGRIIVPGNNQKISNLISWFMAFILFTVLINMTAACGAMLNQLFGINRLIGGVLIAVLVIITVLGEFQRISKVFRFIMPVLFAAVVTVSIIVIFSCEKTAADPASLKPSPIAGNWILAACLYISYNILAMIPIVATSSVNAKSEKTAIIGSGIGGVFLGILAFVIVSALQRDMSFAQAADMPMLAYSTRVSGPVGLIYSVILFAAIYSSATSNFYGFTTKIKNGPHKNRLVISAAALAFFLGLVGFKNVVAYMFPIEGYLGFVIVAMIVMNFFSVWKKSKTHDNSYEFDPFNLPEPLVRVTGGRGGEAILILGSEKTGLYDCGMACFSDKLIENIHRVLDKEKRTVDYIFMSHTHYDHIGALPYILKEWPEAKVCGGEKAVKVFASEGARKTMERLGNKAKEQFGTDIEITTEGLRIDIILKDGDCVSLGKETVTAYETKGHTDCSMSYLLSPYGILFSSESTGVVNGTEFMYPSILKNYNDAIESAYRLKKLEVNKIIVPHYGVLSDDAKKTFFDDFIDAAKAERQLIFRCIEEGLSDEEILEEHKKVYWSEARSHNQPYPAYKLNAEITIRLTRVDFSENYGKIL